ncbi:MAG: right-handed parallel beta-helix repeat-containing protein [Anaerolineales bacterium]|nr:right-handed parallel beta-helix repeat-containing protein [Anaerolineales bacterium]
MKRLPRWTLVLFIAIDLLLLAACGILAALPVEADPDLAKEDWGMGASNIEPSWTGLLRPWPDAPSVDFELANLGYTLFFDPVLSGDNTYSCAHCHHPDLGFSDGKPVAVGPTGEEINRNAPTLWNVAYNTFFFWDGRASSLEEQMIVPLTAPNEMNQNLDALVNELNAIEAYPPLFDALFEDGITSDNVISAIVAFERTLISDGAAFDAYAGGDFTALTAQQRRGLGIFRSAATRCFECHSAPTFKSDAFKVIGVPDGDDTGHGAIDENSVDYAFRVPTLRNVALSGPYMHNGYFTSLEDVIDFYRDGGGPGAGFEAATVDRVIAPGFKLNDQEIEDLIAFLYALTDETIPESMWEQVSYVDEAGHILLPDAVPSGLSPIEPIDNPARAVIAETTAAPDERSECLRDSETRTVTVGDNQTLQQAIDCAEVGDTILVPPRVYHERVVIDLNDITLRGLIENEPDACPVQENGVWPTNEPEWPILDGDIDNDGTKDLTDGIIASGHNFTMEYFVVRNYTGNGVLVEGVTQTTLRHLYTENTGLYGVYPVRSTGVLVECSIATLTTDAGIYVGQSEDIIVRNNLAYDNVTGIEIENSYNADVYANETWNNTGGILVFMLPNLHSRVSRDIHVYDNYVHGNNRPKDDATPGSVVGKIPIGSGIFVMGSDYSEIYNNRIEGNRSFGIALVSMYQAYEPDEIGDVGPLSEHNYIHDNHFKDNGDDPDQAVKDAGLPGADLLWDARGFGNHWDESDASRFPPILPGKNWLGVVERSYFQVVNFVGKRF